MFERFTDRARRTVVLAQDEARALQHPYIGTEHVLLGLLTEGDGVAATALAALDVTSGAVRELVMEIIGQGHAAPGAGHIPFTPRAKKVFELSLREALSLGHNYIGTEHILLGLIREGEGCGAQVLVKLGAELSSVRKTVIGLLTSYTPTGRPIVSDPTFTRHEPYGTITVEWPDPPRRSYEVAHAVLAQYVETLNRIAEVRRYCNGEDFVRADAVLRLLIAANDVSGET